MDGDAIRGRLDVSLRDLEDAVGLDADADAAISWGEVKAREQDIVRYAAQRLRVDADGSACELGASQTTVDTHGGAAYAVLDLEAACPAAPRRVRVSYGLMFDIDPGHRSLVEIGAGEQPRPQYCPPSSARSKRISRPCRRGRASRGSRPKASGISGTGTTISRSSHC